MGLAGIRFDFVFNGCRRGRVEWVVFGVWHREETFLSSGFSRKHRSNYLEPDFTAGMARIVWLRDRYSQMLVEKSRGAITQLRAKSSWRDGHGLVQRAVVVKVRFALQGLPSNSLKIAITLTPHTLSRLPTLFQLLHTSPHFVLISSSFRPHLSTPPPTTEPAPNPQPRPQLSHKANISVTLGTNPCCLRVQVQGFAQWTIRVEETIVWLGTEGFEAVKVNRMPLTSRPGLGRKVSPGKYLFSYVFWLFS